MQTLHLNTKIKPLLTGILMILTASYVCASKYETPVPTPSITIQAYHHKNLQTIFSNHDYAWDNLDRGVPPLILKKFPDDLHLMHSTKLKKELFFRSILPMALLANEEISQQRSTLHAIFEQFDQKGFITLRQQKKLDSISKRYRIKEDALTIQTARKKLLRRVDNIPESLVLSQAANESGWGTSRFARQANNIFGEWTFTPGTGLVPKNRPKGATYEVRRFTTLYQSVRSYMRNINTHRGYKKLRQTREELRQNNQELSGKLLAMGLDNYSTRRSAYSREIQALIKSNRLEQLIARTYLKSDALVPLVEEPASKTGLFSSREALKER
jgi:Bax protein